jgi:hypothetical protein
MSSIVIHRRAGWRDKLSVYQVFLDGEQVGLVKNGAEVTIQTTPGTHSIQLRIEWCSSPELHVNAAAGTTEIVACGANSKLLLGFFYVSIWRGKYIWIKQRVSNPLFQ